MRAVVCRVLPIIGLALVSTLVLAQQPTRKAAESSQEKPVETAPGAAPTREKAAESVKSPVGIAAMPTAAPVDPKSYTIGPEDILLIKVWREEQLSGQVQVRPDGKINLPLINEVEAAGQTPEQLRATVIEKLTEFIAKPEVMVSVQQVLSRRFYVTGAVGRSGAYPLVVPVTVLEAVTNAGFQEYSNPKKITILRKGKLIKFNYSEVIQGKKMEQNIFIENGDFVNVP